MKAGRDESEQQTKWSKEKKIRVMDCPNSCDRRHFGNRDRVEPGWGETGAFH